MAGESVGLSGSATTALQVARDRDRRDSVHPLRDQSEHRTAADLVGERRAGRRVIFLVCLGYAVVGSVFAREAALVAVNRELETARQIQIALLPRDLPHLSHVDLAVRYLPMTAVAGDLYDFAV